MDGRFAQLKEGMSYAEVQALLGKPEAEGGFSRKQRRPLVYKYGEVELHFHPSGYFVRTYVEDEP
jgi:hypothetical protein